MTLHFITSHIVIFSVGELMVTAILALFLFNYKNEAGKPTEQEKSKEMIGVMIMLQLFGAMCMALDIISPPIIHFMGHSGLVGIVVFAPLLLFSAFLSARIITPARILKMVGFTK